MIIDTHFHAFPENYLKLAPNVSRNDVRGVGFHAFNHQEYLDVMDKYGVDVGILSCTAGHIEKAPHRERSLELCKVLNDSFADAHAKYPHRFKAFARPPMVHMDDCIKELKRCFDDLGLHGTMLPTNLAGRYLDDPEFKPFWNEIEKIGKPLFLHPTNSPCDPNWNKFSLHQKILWPADSTLAISRIVYSGTFDLYPKLKLIGSHLGGMIFNYLDRLNWREGNLQCKGQPEDYLRRIYYDTAGPVRTPTIKMACDTVGADQILFGADYPHGREGKDDQFYPMTLKAMDALDLPIEDKEKIYYKNAARLFGFEEGS
ncbi:MAG: amidohydrolase family protein [Candidatus Binatia bacterium]